MYIAFMKVMSLSGVLVFNLLCVICVLFNWVLRGFRFRILNVMWLNRLGFAFILQSFFHFSDTLW